MKFHNDSLNGFQVIMQTSFSVDTVETRFCDRQSSKGNNSKSISARVIVFALCTLSNVN